MKLSENLQQTLRAAIDRIIPADDYPGAWDAGVGNYLQRQFEHDLLPFFADYCDGLGSLEAESRARFEASFAALGDEQKDQILRSVEIGEVRTEWTVKPQVFFKLLTETTVEGFYSEPEQGGNRDRASWIMIGFESK
jgi:hypothetical protein